MASEFVTSPELEHPTSVPNVETAFFAGGCFWCLEAVFNQVNGAISATSGYMGGHVPNPTYRQVCTGTTGHAETVRVTFKPEEVSYGDLLGIFFAIHDPTTLNRQGNDAGTQYRSAIFYASEAQRQAAEQVIAALQTDQAFGGPIVTLVEPAGEFFPAEDYHQEYYANNPSQPYCRLVIEPKLRKFLHAFPQKIKQ
ncbi:MAG: peptide-methionine (S)-S-oxide reductase MsrA [Terriglobales bacterium]